MSAPESGKEGNLLAPTRHSIAWRTPEYSDEPAILAEMERVFDICHGCRRCVSLCNSFPTLFDLIDEGKTGEIDGVAKGDYWKVVDQCYLCDICYMVKCPYVPPHPWNVDFPHLMLRGKAYKFRHGETRFRDRLLTSTDAVGKLATIPVVVKMVNKATHSAAPRRLLEKVLGVDERRWLPDYAATPFDRAAPEARELPVRDGVRTPGKVAIFSTCYVKYNEPGIGLDLIRILDHNDIPYVVVEKEACCGMPKLELGDFATVEKLKNVNIPSLVRYALEGYAILTAVPSCTLMFRLELPLIFPEEENVKTVARAMFDPFEYLVARDKDGLLRKDFKIPLGKVSYHLPCHARVQRLGQKTREVLEWIPETSVNTVERCTGHDGTWGVKTEYFETSMKIGRPVFRQMAETEPDFISSDCPIAGRAIEQGIAESERAAGPASDADALPARRRAIKEHPLTLICRAYGLE